MRRVFFAISVLLLGGLIAVAWYAYDKGFTRKWRGYITEEFRKQGFEVSLRRLTLDPFRGLVAKDVKIFDAKDRRRTLAVVDEMLLGINYANAFQGKTFLDSLDLLDANLSLPLDPANPRGDRVEISKLNARLFLPPQQVYLARAEAEIAGLRVYAAGRLINPQAFRPKRGDRDNSVTEVLARVVDEIQGMKYEKEPPLVAIQFSGDLSQPENVWIDVRVQGEKIKKRDYRLDKIDLAVNLRDGQIELQRCDLRDSNGLLQAHASFTPATRQATFRVRSALDFPSLARSLRLFPELKHWAFYTPPQIELQGRADFAGPSKLELLGHVTFQKFAYKSVVFEGFGADGSWDDNRWSMRSIHLEHRSGEVTGDIMQVPGDFRAKLRGTLSPKLIAPLLSGKAAKWFSQFDFKDSPSFEIDVQGASPTLEAASTTSTEVRLDQAGYSSASVDDE